MTILELIKEASSANATVPVDQIADAHKRVGDVTVNRLQPWRTGRRPVDKLELSKRVREALSKKASGANYSNLGSLGGGGSDYSSLGGSILSQITSRAAQTFDPNNAIDSLQSALPQLRQEWKPPTGSDAARQRSGFWGRLFSGDFEGASDDTYSKYEAMAGSGWKNRGRNAHQWGAEAANAVQTLAEPVLRPGFAAAEGIGAGLIDDTLTKVRGPGAYQRAATVLTSPLANRQTRQLAKDMETARLSKLVNRLGSARASQMYPREYAEFSRLPYSEVQRAEQQVRSRGY